MNETLFILAAILVYGGIHSLFAAFGAKAFFHRTFGARNYHGLYTFLFNVIAVLSFLPILVFVAINPGDTLWNIQPPLQWSFMFIQGIGLIGLVISLLQIDGMRFLGLRQLEAWLNGDKLPLPSEPLQTYGVYRLVRHPLYLFSMLFLWFSPLMTTAGLGLVIGISLYFVVGSWLEERKLLKIFGEPYAIYRQEVPWILPFVKISKRREPTFSPESISPKDGI